jgi:nucleoside-diphosphate-sugar epimerase
MKKILITGASGFIGQSLIKSLSNSTRSVRGTIRSRNLFFSDAKTEYVSTGDINLKTNWRESLINIDCIIHCAGKAHTIKSKKNDLSKIYQSVNVDGTKQLAEQAAEAKVRRLIFLSSIKVNGEDTNNNVIFKFLNEKKKVFSHKDLVSPQDHYAVSKLQAEKALWEISSRTGLEVVVVRLPLVYGYGAKGNLERLIKLVKSGIPLPLSLVKNKRSMIGMDNLVDLLIRCIDHPEVSGKTFLASDGEDLSTPELIKFIASSIGKKANLFPFPISMLKFLGSVFGKREEINRLVGSLRIDNSYTKKILNWTPPISVEEGIRGMVQGK